MKASLYDNLALDQLRRELRIDPQQIHRLRKDLLKRFACDEEAIAEFQAIEHIAFHSLKLHQKCDSNIDGATKLLFRTSMGMLIESVILRIATGRTTLCVSSQVGCAAACEFCATGKMGIAQNLQPVEILDQVLQAGQLLSQEDRRIRNIVFMGMGEPFHNEENLYQVLEALVEPQLCHHSPTKILVSSVGIPDAMIRCARRFPQINLALSLHSIRQETRERLIPLAKKYSIAQLQETLKELNRIQKCSVMIEYLMLQNLNDSLEEARKLADWLQGMNVHVNLIPYNPIEEAPELKSTLPPQREAFAAVLKEAGLPTTIRYSLGSDIAAACGQLVKKENRQIAQLNASL